MKISLVVQQQSYHNMRRIYLLFFSFKYNKLKNMFHAYSTIISAYLVLYILGSMYIDLAHTGDEPCECTGCDKGFINELYKWDTSYQFRFSIFILVFLSLDFINELYTMHLITHIFGRQVVLRRDYHSPCQI